MREYTYILTKEDEKTPLKDLLRKKFDFSSRLRTKIKRERLVFLNEKDECDYSSFYWTFGEPLIKKYQFVFNQNSKRIGLYTSLGDNNNSMNSNNESWWARNKWYLLIIVLLFIFFMSLIIVLYFKMKPKRKMKANELDDDFEYSSSKDPSDNKLINN